MKWKRLGQVVFWFGVAVLLYAFVGFIVVPEVAKAVIEYKLPKVLNRSVSVKKIRLNPFLLTLGVDEFVLSNRNSRTNFVYFDELFIDLEAASIFKKALIVKAVRLRGPFIQLTRYEDDSLNFSDLLEGGEEKPAPAPAEESGEGAKFSINNIEVMDGNITFFDVATLTRHYVRDLFFSTPFVSNLPYNVETYVQPAFSARINDRIIKVDGHTKPFADSRETEMALQLHRLDIPYYLGYVPGKRNFDLASAILDAKLDITFTQPNKGASRLAVTGDITVSDVEIVDDGDKPFFTLASVRTSIAPTNLLAGEFRIAEVAIDSPHVRLTRRENGELYIPSLDAGESEPAEPPKTDDAAAKADAAPPNLRVDRVALGNGQVDFADNALDAPFRAGIKELTVEVKDVSFDSGTGATATLSTVTDAGARIQASSTFGLNPVSAAAALTIDDIDLPRLRPYVKDHIRSEITGGKLSVGAKVQADVGDGTSRVTLSDGAVTLRNLKITERATKAALISLAEFAITGVSCDPKAQTATVGQVALRSTKVNVKRDEAGDINLATAFTPEPAENAPPPAESAPAAAAEEEGAASPPWTVAVNEVRVSDVDVLFKDLAAAAPVTIAVDDVTLSVDGFSTKPKNSATTKLSLRIAKKGQVTVNGTFGIDPVVADLDLNLTGLPLKPFQPYFTDAVNILVTDGQVGTSGHVRAAVKPDAAPTVAFGGKVAITNLKTVDKVHAEDLLGFGALKIDGIDFKLEPLDVRIDSVALSEPTVHAVLWEDGNMNLASIAATPPAAAEPEPAPPASETAAPSEPPPFRVGKISLDGGAVTFADRTVKPSYQLNVDDLTVAVTGVSLEKTQRTSVTLGAKLADHAPLSVKAEGAFLAEDPSAEFAVDLRGFDLTPFTPYSGRYVGRALDKGKLSLDLDYKIAGRKLSSTNKALLDQLELGRKIESPDAMKLPLGLALALLKDRKGQINIDVPVGGDLDDPEFKLGKVIIHVLVNLITKAATSPFALLGSLAGSDEDLSMVSFAAGSSDLDDAGKKALEALTKALHERPGLSLEIRGHVDPDTDRVALARDALMRLLKAEKLKEQVAAGGTATAIDQITLSAEEVPVYMAKAYDAAGLPRQVDEAGKPLPLPVETMEAQLLLGISIDEDQLRALAGARASTVQSFILAAKQVEPERLFALDPTLGPGEDADAPARRVQLGVR